MFENFPYTNFHDLNLDWIIQKIMESYSPDNPPPVGLVLSVNGETGAVILYREQNVQLPSIEETSWNFYRLTDNTTSGIKFTNGQPAERIDGANRYQIYDSGNPPPSVNPPVSSVDGMTGAVKTWANSDYQTLQTPTAAPGTIWDLRRELSNGDKVGIEFSYDATSQAYKAYLKYTPSGSNVPVTVELLTSANIPESGVVSVNGKTGIVTLTGTDIIVSGSETLAAAITRLETAIAEKYTKPAGGIPASDLATGVIPDVSGFQEKPSVMGTAGQVLGLSSQLQPVWINQPSTSGLQPAPVQPGSSGQVLGLDSNLNPVWVNQSGGGTDLSNLVRIESYSSDSARIGANTKEGFTGNDFAISGIAGYTPIALTRAYCNAVEISLSDYNIASATAGTTKFIFFKNSSSGMLAGLTLNISILWIKTSAMI